MWGWGGWENGIGEYEKLIKDTQNVHMSKKCGNFCYFVLDEREILLVEYFFESI